MQKSKPILIGVLLIALLVFVAFLVMGNLEGNPLPKVDPFKQQQGEPFTPPGQSEPSGVEQSPEQW